jgi:hypothetical protein
MNSLTTQAAPSRSAAPVRIGRLLACIAAGLLAMPPGGGVVRSQDLADAYRVSRPGLYYNAKALGMGNAHSTVGYDFSALHFNPATMAGTDKGSFTMSLAWHGIRSSSDYYGTSDDFSTTSTSNNQAGLVLPFQLDSVRNLMIGIGYTGAKDFNSGFKYSGINGGSASWVQILAAARNQTAKDLALSYEMVDASSNYTGDTTILGAGMLEEGYYLGEGVLVSFPVGFAVEAVRNIFFGVSGSYNTGRFTGDLELSANDVNDVYGLGTRTVPQDPLTEGFENSSLRLVRSKTYTGWDIRFGILYKLENFIGISGSFKIPSHYKVDEELFTSGATSFAGNVSHVLDETRTASEYSFQPPTEITVGAMVNLWFITGTLEAHYLNYAEMKVTAGADIPDRTDLNKRIKDELGSVINLNGGAEFRLPFTGLIARAGFIYLPSQYEADPSRFARKILTAGFGINSSDIMAFDIAYAYGWWGEHQSQQEATEPMVDQFIDSHSVILSMTFSP